MPEIWLTGQHWLSDNLNPSGSQVLLFGVLLLTTFLLEDVAIAAGASLAIAGSVSWEFAFAAVAGGIALGDWGLFWIGQQSHHVQWLKRRYVDQRTQLFKQKIEHRLASVIFVARVVPGLRLVTYVACGYLRIRFLPFALWVLLSVTLWTAGLFLASSVFGDRISELLGIPSAIAAPLLILLLAFAIPIFRRLFAHA